MAYSPQTVSVALNFSPDVYQAAQATQLGDQPRAEYHPKTTVKNVILGLLSVLVGLAFIAGGVAASGDTSGNSGLVSLLLLLLIGIAIAGGGFYLMASGAIYKNWGVYVYVQGFVYKAGSKAAQPFRWDQIEAAWYSVVRRSYNGIPTGTYHSYRVRRVDGFEIKLNDRFANVAQLGELIHNQVTATRLPQVIAAYNAGQTITFGPLSVSAQGLINANNKVLPWSEIKGVSVQSGYIAVSQAGKWLKWSTRSVSEIPNVFLFIALVNGILKK